KLEASRNPPRGGSLFLERPDRRRESPSAAVGFARSAPRVGAPSRALLAAVPHRDAPRVGRRGHSRALAPPPPRARALARCSGRYILSIIAWPKPEVETCFAPCIRRAKS